MDLKGCHVALVTPFLNDGALDEDGFRKNIDFLIDNGVAGIVPCGTTGESATLTWEEHHRVVDVALDQAAGRVTVIAGAGSNCTAEAVSAARHAREHKADAILCITPYYNKPTQEGLFQHFRAIALEVDIPVVVYNVPSRTGVNIRPETLERLCAFENIVAVKEASGDLVQITEIHSRCGDRLAILSGEDALTLPMLACGGVGTISVTANIVPARMREMIDSFFAGDMQRARELHEQLLPITRAMFIETNPIPVKTAMRALGMAAGPLRLPLVDMAEQNKAVLLDVIKTIS